MIHNLLILFVSEHTVRTPAVQATLHTPPAPSMPGDRDSYSAGQGWRSQLRFVAGVVANATGFAGLIAGCWLGLQVLQSFL